VPASAGCERQVWLAFYTQEEAMATHSSHSASAPQPPILRCQTSRQKAGDSVAIGPLPQLRHGARRGTCVLLGVELGFLRSSYVPDMGLFRIGCLGCNCSRRAGSGSKFKSWPDMAGSLTSHDQLAEARCT
jgi:hypothetical protein